MDLQVAVQKINELIAQKQYGTHPSELYEPIRYIMSLGGKRMRPLLVLLGYYLFKDDWEEALTPATAVEVFHNFTLMHDDIMDKAALRRGQATVHHKWNENIAILSGDTMLVKAYEALLQGVPAQYLVEALQKFNECACQVCEGQQLDMNFEACEDVTEEEYIEMIQLKTAVLLGFSLELGALLAGADEDNRTLLRDFGINMGIGFQLKDDLLDVYGEQQKFGKEVGGDIVANKKTFLLIEALNLAPAEELIQLRHWMNIQDFEREEKVKAVTEIYNQLNIKGITLDRMEEFFNLAFEKLHALQAQESKKAFLENFTRQIIQREN